MRKAGKESERPGAWSMFQENWPAIFGATALGLAVALLGRWWLSSPSSTNEAVAQSLESRPETEPRPLASDDSFRGHAVETAAPAAEALAEPASSWQLAPVPNALQEPVRVVSVDPQDDAAPSGAWLTGRIEEVVDEPPLANAARLLDDLPVRR